MHCTTPFDLKSSEQQVLKNVRDLIGYESVSESVLEFGPLWLVDKAISQEKENNKVKDRTDAAYEPVDVPSLPKGSNIISSHAFYQVKKDGVDEKLKLKCRLVPHGNRYKQKDEIRKDSATCPILHHTNHPLYPCTLQLLLRNLGYQW